MNEYSPLTSEFGSAEEEAAYDEWLKKKVEASLADGRPTIPHDQVMAEVRATLEKAKARADKR
jgi:hypothetical protein